MKSSIILRAARHKIRTPDRWCKQRYFKHSPSAGIAFCAVGALRNTALRDVSSRIVSDYNDDPRTTHADILRLYDKAIELAEAAGD